MNYLLVHGAFRGGWAWGPVRRRLTAAGHQVLAPSLAGMGELSPPANDRGHISLTQWCEQLWALAEMEDIDRLILVGHSQGGFVARAAAHGFGERLGAVAYLDAPIATRGERGVDLGGGPAPVDLPPPDTWLEPTPLVADPHQTAELVGWVNERICATPLGPSLDPIDSQEPLVPVHVAFCAHTPDGYPSTLSRAQLDRSSTPYVLLQAPHDAPLTNPDDVAAWLVGLTTG